MTRSVRAARTAEVKVVVEIAPTAILNAAGIESLLGLKTNTIRRERRLGRIRACKRGGRNFYTGADVLAWVQGGRETPDTLDDLPKVR